MIFIDPDLTFTDVNRASIKFSISNILEKIDHFQNDFEKTVAVNGFVIELGLPNIIYFPDVNDIYTSTIKSISLNEKAIDFGALSDSDKESILAQIPNMLFTHINKYITQISNQLQDFVIIEKNLQFNIEEINTNIISNGFMQFILNIFSTGLKNFFEMLYVFSNKLSITGDTFFNMSPLDSRVLVNIYNAEIAEENRRAALQSQNSA